jgi:hypothetical protein
MVAVVTNLSENASETKDAAQAPAPVAAQPLRKEDYEELLAQLLPASETVKRIGSARISQKLEELLVFIVEEHKELVYREYAARGFGHTGS